MKWISLFLWLILLAFIHSKAFGYISIDTLSVFDAKINGKLTFSARGSYNPNKTQPELKSSHYGECVDVRIQNSSDTEIAVKLEAGTILLSKISHTQNMLVTKTTYYTLQPNQKYLGRVYAMCEEFRKNPPDIYVNYEIGKLATPLLCRLAKFIDIYNEQNLAGQYALWAVTDKATVKELGENYAVLEHSQQILDKANIDFNIFGTHTVAKNNVVISEKVAVTNENYDPKPQVIIDTANVSIEVTPVYKIESQSIKIGETSWWEGEEDVFLGIGGILLLIFVVLFFQLRKANKEK
jgi:hypothetical protein